MKKAAKIMAALLVFALLTGVAPALASGEASGGAEDALDISRYEGDWTYMAENSFVLGSGGKQATGADSAASGEVSQDAVYNAVPVWALTGIPYVENPTMVDGGPLQVMNIFVPGAYMTAGPTGGAVIDPEGSMTVDYFDETGELVGAYTWTAQTAPVVFINTVDGYAGSMAFNISGSKAGIYYYEFLEKGFIVVGVTSRGIGLSMGPSREPATVDDDGIVVGKAPAGIVDLKAAVAFLRYNDAVLPGDSEHIFTHGASAGGAMSALLGASGDAAGYKPYLEEIGAADASDAVFGSLVFCPIADLDHGDAAYEWNHKYQTWDSLMGDFTPYQMALHNTLIDIYVEYVRSLGFDLGDDGESGAYYDELTEKLIEALNHGVTVSTYTGEAVTPEEVAAALNTEGSILDRWLAENGLTMDDVLVWNEEKETFEIDGFRILDMSGVYSRRKPVPGFDGNTESGLFGPNGTTEDVSAHFSIVYLEALERLMASEDEEIAAQAAAAYEDCAAEILLVTGSGVTDLMNPMYYLAGNADSTKAQCWRFHIGTSDSDLGTSASWLMYNTLRAADEDYVTEFELIYGAPHSAADYLTVIGSRKIPQNALTWIAQCAAGDVTR